MSPSPLTVKRRFQLPRTSSDAVGMSTFFLGGILLLWYEVWHILPTYYPEDASLSPEEEKWRLRELYFHYAVAVFFAVNIYGNMYKIIVTDTSRDRFLFNAGALMPEGWRYCSECDLNLPPRSHHCKVCDNCMLKRDHHCWFTGCCIGYYNHRYYVAMVTHMVCAALYCNIFNLSFVVSIKGHLTLYTFLSYFGPHIGLLLGYYDMYVFFITLQTSIGTVLLFIFSWLFYIQAYQIFYGQTKYETKKRIKCYNLGILHTLREVLGKRWYLVFLFPWIPSPLLGNGTQFKVKNN